jgi:hypothetical protein
MPPMIYPINLVSPSIRPELIHLIRWLRVLNSKFQISDPRFAAFLTHGVYDVIDGANGVPRDSLDCRNQSPLAKRR